MQREPVEQQLFQFFFSLTGGTEVSLVIEISVNAYISKCLYMFHRKQKHIQNINIVINGMHIERVESFNFLCITLTETLC